MKRFIVTLKAMKQFLLTIFIFSLIIAGCASTEKTGMANKKDIQARNKAQARRYLKEIFEERDASKAHEFISPKLRTNGKPEPDILQGLPNFVKYIDTHFSKPEVVQELFMIAEGNWVASWSAINITYYPGGNAGKENAFGREMKTRGMAFYEFDENGLMIQNIKIGNDEEQIARIDAEYAEQLKQGQ